jgi:hypothetical protein
MTTSARTRYTGYRFPAEIIGHAVWLYFCFPLGLRMVEELLASARAGIDAAGSRRARRSESFSIESCRCVGGNDIFGGMRRATGGADDSGGPGARPKRLTGSAPIRPPASNTLLCKYLPRWPLLTTRQSAALLGTALGAGLGAGIGAAAGNAGKGAAIGAASGGALGIIGYSGGAPYGQESLQQQYDIMYGQCMAAHGNSVASLSPRPRTPPYSGSASAYSGGPR